MLWYTLTAGWMKWQITVLTQSMLIQRSPLLCYCVLTGGPTPRHWPWALIRCWLASGFPVCSFNRSQTLGQLPSVWQAIVHTCRMWGGFCWTSWYQTIFKPCVPGFTDNICLNVAYLRDNRRGLTGTTPLGLLSDTGARIMQSLSGGKSVSHCTLLKEPQATPGGTLRFNETLVEKDWSTYLM